MITFWTIFLYNKTFTTLLTLVVLYIRVYIPYVVCTLLLIPRCVFSVKQRLSLSLFHFFSLFSRRRLLFISTSLCYPEEASSFSSLSETSSLFSEEEEEKDEETGGSNHLGAADQDALALSFRERFSNAFFRQTDGFNRRVRRDFKHRVG